MKHDILYLGSQSKPRRKLLEEVGIPYQVLDHQSDENVDTRDLDYFAYVLAIAQHKMAHIILPEHSAQTGDYIFVVTADSLVRAVESNEIFGKPKDKEDAKRVLRILRNQPIEVATACCLEKKIWNGSAWKLQSFDYWVTEAIVEFSIEEDHLELYLKRVPESFNSAGASIIENFGQNYFKSIKGSYTATKGLPLFELRQALIKFGFKFPW